MVQSLYRPTVYRSNIHSLSSLQLNNLPPYVYYAALYICCCTFSKSLPYCSAHSQPRLLSACFYCPYLMFFKCPFPSVNIFIYVFWRWTTRISYFVDSCTSFFYKSEFKLQNCKALPTKLLGFNVLPCLLRCSGLKQIKSICQCVYNRCLKCSTRMFYFIFAPSLTNYRPFVVVHSFLSLWWWLNMIHPDTCLI